MAPRGNTLILGRQRSGIGINGGTVKFIQSSDGAKAAEDYSREGMKEPWRGIWNSKAIERV